MQRRGFHALSLLAASGAWVAAPATAQSSAGMSVPFMSGVIGGDTRLELINAGFKSPQGPVGLPDGSLLFTEAPTGRIYRVAPDGVLSVALEHIEGVHILAWGNHGDLYALQTRESGAGRVGVIFPQQRQRVLTDRIDDRAFGVHGDLVLGQIGQIYFTDPGSSGASGPGEASASPAAVHRLSARSGQAQRLIDGLQRPQGIQLSPNERVLYVTETGGEHLLAFALLEDGTEAGAAQRWARLPQGAASRAAGLTVDVRGRVFVATAQGVQVFGDLGEPLGLIPTPQPVRNVAFAGPGKRTLFLLGEDAVYRVATTTSGYGGRAK